MNNLKSKKILYIGEHRGNSISRYRAIKAHVPNSHIISYHSFYDKLYGKVINKVSNSSFNKMCSKKVLNAFESIEPNIVWVEMGREIDDEVIRYMKDNDTFLVNTYSDSFTDTVSKKVSINYNKSIKYYDIIFTPRESDFPLYESYGAKNVNKFWKGFDSNSISSFKRALIDLDFIFAGHMEKKRYEFFRYLISQQSFLYKIFGTGWKKTTLSNTYPSLPFEDYSSVYESTNIGVNFFSTWANDTQNSRLFEIPASNTLLVSERSEDALSCFEEDKEAIFFDSKEEFYDKLRFYTVNKVVADRIRERGFQKATNNYSNIARVKQMLSVISELIN